MGRSRTDCNTGGEESQRVGKRQVTREREPHIQELLLQSTQTHRASADRHTKALQDTSSTAHGH